jgi:hypothetical protein
MTNEEPSVVAAIVSVSLSVDPGRMHAEARSGSVACLQSACFQYFDSSRYGGNGLECPIGSWWLKT